MIYIVEEEIVKSGRYEIIESYSNMNIKIFSEDDTGEDDETHRRYLATSGKKNYYYVSYYRASEIQYYEQIVMGNK